MHGLFPSWYTVVHGDGRAVSFFVLSTGRGHRCVQRDGGTPMSTMCGSCRYGQKKAKGFVGADRIRISVPNLKNNSLLNVLTYNE